jgi:polysaccharide export outer membrane protein
MDGLVVRGRFGAVALLLLAGCSSAMLGRGGGHRLTDQAKMLRAAQPEPWPIPRELDKRVAAPYVVEPGDILLVQPASLDSPVRLPGDQAVLPDGTISLGRHGQVIVAGKTIPQIERDVRAAINAQDKEAGVIIVRLVTRVSKVYYVLGEVNAPGSFTWNGYETVLNAIVTAGGLNDRASRHNIILARPTKPDSCREVLPVCYLDIVQLGDTSTNYQILAGDRVYVPTRGHKENRNERKCPTPPCGRPQTPCPPPPPPPHPGPPLPPEVVLQPSRPQPTPAPAGSGRTTR